MLKALKAIWSNKLFLRTIVGSTTQNCVMKVIRDTFLNFSSNVRQCGDTTELFDHKDFPYHWPGPDHWILLTPWTRCSLFSPPGEQTGHCCPSVPPPRPGLSLCPLISDEHLSSSLFLWLTGWGWFSLFWFGSNPPDFYVPGTHKYTHCDN